MDRIYSIKSFHGAMDASGENYIYSCEPMHARICSNKNCFHLNVSITEIALYTLCFQLCSVHYTELQMKKTTRRTSTINPATTENLDDSH